MSRQTDIEAHESRAAEARRRIARAAPPVVTRPAATTRHRPAHIPPFKPNLIRYAMHLAIALKPAPITVVEPVEPAGIDAPAVATNANVNPFAGLLRVPAADDAAAEQADGLDSDHPRRRDSDLDQLAPKRRLIEAAANDVQIDSTASKGLSRDRALTRNAIGPRIVAARALNGLTQGELAVLLGYENAAHLSQIEAGRRSPSLEFVLRVAKALAVSIDWLFGVSEEVDHDPKQARRAALLRSVRGQLNSVMGVVVETFERHQALANPVRDKALVGAAEAVVAAFSRFTEINEHIFDELRGGASLAHATRALGEQATAARASVAQHDAFDAELRKSIGRVRASAVDEVADLDEADDHDN